MNDIERDIERIKIECEFARLENERRISRLAMARHLAMLMANMKVKQNKKATKFAQELFFNAVMGVSLVALIFGFVILIKVLIG